MSSELAGGKDSVLSVYCETIGTSLINVTSKFEVNMLLVRNNIYLYLEDSVESMTVTIGKDMYEWLIEKGINMLIIDKRDRTVSMNLLYE